MRQEPTFEIPSPTENTPPPPKKRGGGGGRSGGNGPSSVFTAVFLLVFLAIGLGTGFYFGKEFGEKNATVDNENLRRQFAGECYAHMDKNIENLTALFEKNAEDQRKAAAKLERYWAQETKKIKGALGNVKKLSSAMGKLSTAKDVRKASGALSGGISKLKEDLATGFKDLSFDQKKNWAMNQDISSKVKALPDYTGSLSKLQASLSNVQGSIARLEKVCKTKVTSKPSPVKPGPQGGQ